MIIWKEGRPDYSKLFAESEKAFRDAEERTIRDLSRMEGIVIATGGGVIKEKPMWTGFMKEGSLFPGPPSGGYCNGCGSRKRPLLKEGPDRVFALYKERIALYREAADITVANRGRDEEVLENLVAALKEQG